MFFLLSWYHFLSAWAFSLNFLFSYRSVCDFLQLLYAWTKVLTFPPFLKGIFPGDRLPKLAGFVFLFAPLQGCPSVSWLNIVSSEKFQGRLEGLWPLRLCMWCVSACSWSRLAVLWATPGAPHTLACPLPAPPSGRCAVSEMAADWSSNHGNFWERQCQEHSKRVAGCQGLGSGEEKHREFLWQRNYPVWQHTDKCMSLYISPD